MTKKKKTIIIFSFIGVLLITGSIMLCCFVFFKPSILGRWTTNMNGAKYIYKFKDNNRLDATIESITTLKNGNAQIESTKLYYKVENDIIYINDTDDFKSDSTVKMYIVSLSSKELVVTSDENSTLKVTFSKL